MNFKDKGFFLQNNTSHVQYFHLKA